MGRLKEAIYGRFSTVQNNPTAVGPLEDDRLLRLRTEIGQIGSLLTEKIDELTLVAKQSEEIVNNQIKRSEEVVESLWQEITVLEGKLQQVENTARQKEDASHKAENTLGTEVCKLQNELAAKGKEIDELKSKNDSYIGRVAELDSVIAQNKLDTAKEAELHEHIGQTLKDDIDLLKVRLQGAEEISREKDLTVQRLEQEHAVKVQQFEGQITKKDQLLAERDAEITELKSQLQFLTRGIKDSSSFFRQAEAFAHRRTEEKGGAPIDPTNREGENSIRASSATKTEETVSSEFLDRATEHLTLSIGPMAPIIMRDHIVALGERTEKFPKRRVVELLDILSNEIANSDLRFNFRNWFAQQLSTA